MRSPTTRPRCRCRPRCRHRAWSASSKARSSWHARTPRPSPASCAAGSAPTSRPRAEVCPMDETGLENSAILLMSPGEEDAAQVLKHLTPKEVQGVGETISRMKSIPRERVDNVLEMFSSVAGDNVTPVADTDAYVRSVLKKALGEDKATILLDRILASDEVEGIDNLRWMDTAAVAELMRDESPQIVAAILVHLETGQASAVLKL